MLARLAELVDATDLKKSKTTETGKGGDSAEREAPKGRPEKETTNGAGGGFRKPQTIYDRGEKNWGRSRRHRVRFVQAPWTESPQMRGIQPANAPIEEPAGWFVFVVCLCSRARGRYNFERLRAWRNW